MRSKKALEEEKRKREDKKAFLHLNRFPTVEAKSPRGREDPHSRVGMKLVVGKHRQLSLIGKRANLKDYESLGSSRTRSSWRS